MRTPIASENEGGAIHEQDAKQNGNSLKLGWQILSHFGYIQPKLLPTPTVAHLRNHDEPVENYEARVQQWRDGELRGKPGVSLGVEVRRALFRTPIVDDSKNDGRNQNRYETLARQVLTTEWGKYEPAIRRWEQTINTPAPNATIPDGRDGNHRLNPEFAEWLMGIPGRLNDLDLTRAERLKMAGNGVCPQQAELALSILIERLNNNGQLAR